MNDLFIQQQKCFNTINSFLEKFKIQKKCVPYIHVNSTKWSSYWHIYIYGCVCFKSGFKRG